MRRTTRVAVGLGLATSIVLTGCSTKAGNSSGGDSGDLKTDFGVTDDAIHLLELEDLSGPFRVATLAYSYGIKLWAEEVNAAGGICERDIVVDLKDMNYKADLAVSIYEAEKDNNVAMVSLAGSPMLAALKTKITADNMLTVPGAWASSVMDSDAIMMIGQTYDVEMINALSYVQEQGMIADGDKIGHIYVDSEFGQGGLMGSKAYAKNHDMNVVEATISATDTDMTATVTKLKADGVKAIALSVPPAATGSVAIQNIAQDLNVPLVGNNPAFAPTLLSDPSVVAGLKNFYLAHSTLPLSSDNAKSQELLEKYQGMTADPPHIGVTMAYVWGQVWTEVLQTACDNGDMTRAGIVAARKQVTDVDVDSLQGKQDLSDPGAPSTREGYILQADPSVPGALVAITELFSSEDAQEYKAPHQK
jgi:ABC-type branched-subunit amino acid transport system substrate-binding protein